MQRGLIFWVLMLIWFVFALVLNFGGAAVLGGMAHAGTVPIRSLSSSYSRCWAGKCMALPFAVDTINSDRPTNGPALIRYQRSVISNQENGLDP